MYVLNDANVAIMAAAKVILCVIFEEFSEPDEIGINTFFNTAKNTRSYSHCPCCQE